MNKTLAVIKIISLLGLIIVAGKAKGASDLANADLEAAERINPDVKKIAEQQWQLMARLQSP